jgi:glutamine synthetase adenylyltransferase
MAEADARASGDGDGVKSFIGHLDMTGIITGAAADAAPQPGRSSLAGPADTGSGAGDPAAAPEAGSRFFQRLQRRYASQLPLLPAGAPTPPSIATTFATLRAQGNPPGAALRILRQLVMHRLIVLDCAQQALDVITHGVTALAEFALDVACSEAFTELDARHGAPMSSLGKRAQLWVVGMGKLGARELNVSSDIDLIYIYDEDGETTGTPDGRGRISNQEYFSRAVRLIFGIDRRHHRARLRVSGGSGAAPQRQFGAARRVAGRP